MKLMPNIITQLPLKQQFNFKQMNRINANEAHKKDIF